MYYYVKIVAEKSFYFFPSEICTHFKQYTLIVSTNFSVFALRVLAYTNFSDFLCLHN